MIDKILAGLPTTEDGTKYSCTDVASIFSHELQIRDAMQSQLEILIVNLTLLQGHYVRMPFGPARDCIKPLYDQVNEVQSILARADRENGQAS